MPLHCGPVSGVATAVAVIAVTIGTRTFRTRSALLSASEGKL
jgi:hypothetical protein